MKSRSTFVGLCALSSCAIAATDLPPILVSATRSEQPGLDIPTATTIIDRRTIDGTGARNITDLLHRIAGVHVSDSVGDGGSASIDMRGFGGAASSNVAVLIDGRKINPATDTGTLYLNSVDLDEVEQIEIIHGSAGVLYGNQAVGGLINIVTSRATGRSRQLVVGAGSYDAWEIGARLSEPLGELAVLSLHAERRDSDNYREHNASRLERYSGRLEVTHTGGFSYLDLERLNDYVQTPGALFSDELKDDRRQAVFPDDYLDTTSTVLRLGTRRRLNTQWRFEGEIAWRDDHRDFEQSFRGFPGSPSTQDRESTEVSPRLIGVLGDTTATLGIDYLTTDYRLVTAFGPQGDEQAITAYYAQLTHAVTDRLSVTGGIRHALVDNEIDIGAQPVSIDDAVTVASFGLVYRPDTAWRLFLRADQNYRFAKVDEHTNVPFGQPIGLDTQTGVSYETGAEYRHGGLTLSASAYLLKLRDEISFEAVSFTNVNLPRSRRIGGTLSFAADLSPTLGVGAAVEYIDSEITSGVHEGSRVPLVPMQRANLYADYRPWDAWLVRLDVEHVGAQYLGSDFSNSAPRLDDYTVANLAAHYDRGDWRLTAKVNNLFDERYSETGASAFAGDGFIPAPERNFWIGASYRFEE